MGHDHPPSGCLLRDSPSNSSPGRQVIVIPSSCSVPAPALVVMPFAGWIQGQLNLTKVPLRRLQADLLYRDKLFRANQWSIDSQDLHHSAGENTPRFMWQRPSKGQQ